MVEFLNKSLLPGFERACRNMYAQINTAFENGTKQCELMSITVESCPELIELPNIGNRAMFRALFDLESDPDPHPNKNL